MTLNNISLTNFSSSSFQINKIKILCKNGVDSFLIHRCLDWEKNTTSMLWWCFSINMEMGLAWTIIVPESSLSFFEEFSAEDQEGSKVLELFKKKFSHSKCVKS